MEFDCLLSTLRVQGDSTGNLSVKLPTPERGSVRGTFVGPCRIGFELPNGTVDREYFEEYFHALSGHLLRVILGSRTRK